MWETYASTRRRRIFGSQIWRLAIINSGLRTVGRRCPLNLGTFWIRSMCCQCLYNCFVIYLFMCLFIYAFIHSFIFIFAYWRLRGSKNFFSPLEIQWSQWPCKGWESPEYTCYSYNKRERKASNKEEGLTWEIWMALKKVKGIYSLGAHQFASFSVKFSSCSLNVTILPVHRRYFTYCQHSSLVKPRCELGILVNTKPG